MTDFQTKIRHWSYTRQCLGKQGTNAEQVLKDIIGVYSSHPTAPLSLFARTKNFNQQTFNQLDEDRLAYRIPAMRQSVYMLPKDATYKISAAIIPPANDPYWDKRYKQKGRELSKDKYENWKEKILEQLNRPFTLSELKKIPGIPGEKLKLVLNRMAFEGILLRIGSTNLRSNIISYVATDSWTNNFTEQEDPDLALNWLAGEYLRAFGPVRIKDFQWWAGITATKAKKSIAALLTVPLENDYLLLAEDLSKFESFKITSKNSIDILPQWDSYIMGYAPDGRERFACSDNQDKIYGKLGATGGNALGTVLVNGLAFGSWSSRFKGDKMLVSLNIFDKVSGKLKNDIKDQFEKIAAFLNAKSLVIENN